MGKTDYNMKECSECKSTFIRQSDMLRHIKRFHPSKAEKLLANLESKMYPFKCNECNKGFLHKRNLSFHENSHDVVNSGVLIRKKCPLCDHVATFKKDFYDHCREAHDILLDVVKMDFATTEDFENWKDEIEKALDSNFVKEYGSTPKMTNYICDQSEYSVLENGVEVPGSQSIKVNGFCPAGFRVMHEEASGKCSIYFVKTHICYQNKSLIFPNNSESQKSPKEKSPKTSKGKNRPKEKIQQLRKKSQKIQNNAELEKNQENQVNQVDEIPEANSTPEKTSEKIAVNMKKRSFTAIPKKKSEKIVVSTKKKTFLNKKKEMIKNILTTLNTVSNTTELEAVQELINPIKPILEILKKKSGNHSPKGKLLEKSMSPNK